MDSGNTLHDMEFQLITIGDAGVGKTCLLLRYANNSFSPNLIVRGIDIKIKNVAVDGTLIKLMILDASCAERFRSIGNSYYRRGKGILLVYDVTDRRSFESIRDWMLKIQQHADEHVNIILIGNKCDMLDEKVVSTEEAAKLAKEFGMDFWECSAKNNINVDDCFMGITRGVKDRLVADGKGGPAECKGLNLKTNQAEGPKRCF